MRIWVDVTNSPHVVVLRPVIERWRADGHDVRITARDFAQTLGLLERYGLSHTAIGHHQGAGLPAKARGLAARSGALVRWARRNGPFDLAVGHGSNDQPVAAALLRIPTATTFDYEWATFQHSINCRLADAVVIPQDLPAERLERYGARGKVLQYPGLKEEYALADFEPDPAVLAELGLDVEQPIAVVRTPAEMSAYHRFHNSIFHDVLDRLRGTQTVVLPRTPAQRDELGDGLIVPSRVIDTQSLVAYADLVVSAGGTMNREAVALGTPVWTTFEGRLGAVDEGLIASGRLRMLESVDQIALVKRTRGEGDGAGRVRRDPRLLADLLSSPARQLRRRI
jgi:predicted glycosyltransferase